MSEEANDEIENQEQFEALVFTIGQALHEGKSQSDIVDEIVEEDADPETRHEVSELVFNVANSLAESSASHSGAMAGHSDGMSSWAIWIGVLVVVNILSATFDWPFWLY